MRFLKQQSWRREFAQTRCHNRMCQEWTAVSTNPPIIPPCEWSEKAYKEELQDRTNLPAIQVKTSLDLEKKGTWSVGSSSACSWTYNPGPHQYAQNMSNQRLLCDSNYIRSQFNSVQLILIMPQYMEIMSWKLWFLISADWKVWQVKSFSTYGISDWYA